MVEMQAMLWTYTSGLRGRAQNWPVAGRSACRGEVGLPRAGLVLLFRECGGECGNPNPLGVRADTQNNKSPARFHQQLKSIQLLYLTFQKKKVKDKEEHSSFEYFKTANKFLERI